MNGMNEKTMVKNRNTTQLMEKIAVEISFPKLSPMNKKESESKLDASKYTLPFTLGLKLISSPFVISISLAAFYSFQSYLEPFFELKHLLTDFDYPFSLQTVTTLIVDKIANKGRLPGEPDFRSAPFEEYLSHVTDKIKIFNKMFYVGDMQELRDRFTNQDETNRWRARNPLDLGKPDTREHFKAKNLFNRFGPGMEKEYTSQAIYDKLRPILFDNILTQQYPLFFRQFFSILLFVMESNYIPILIGVVGGSALVFNFSRRMIRSRQKKKSEKEGKTLLHHGEHPVILEAEKGDEFINVITKIGEHFQFAFVKQNESETHISLSFEHIMDGEAKHIQQYKHFLKALPQNVFINHVNHVLEGVSTKVFPVIHNARAKMKEKEKEIDKKHVHVREQLKKYADIHVQRYAFQYPKTMTQKVKSYVMYKPTFSQNSLS